MKSSKTKVLRNQRILIIVNNSKIRKITINKKNLKDKNKDRNLNKNQNKNQQNNKIKKIHNDILMSIIV